MKRNLSDTDRIIRFVLAVVFAYLYLGGIVTGTAGILLILLAAALVLTSVVAFCPLYAPLKFSTYKG